MKTSHLLAPAMLALSMLPAASHATGFTYVAPLVPQHRGDVTYLSGGVSLEERKVMRPMAKDYNLKLEFANAKGQYLADVKVAVKDANGNTVFTGVSDGPWLYLTVPAGTYEVSASDQKTRTVKAKDMSDRRVADVLFYLKDTPASEVAQAAQVAKLDHRRTGG